MKPVSNSNEKFVQAIMEAFLNENASEGRKTNIVCIVSVDSKVVSSIGAPLRHSMHDLPVQMPDDSLILLQTIILNISPSAVRFFRFEDGCIAASCRVGGQETAFLVPLGAILKAVTPGHTHVEVAFPVDLKALASAGSEKATEEKVESNRSKVTIVKPKRPTLTVVK